MARPEHLPETSKTTANTKPALVLLAILGIGILARLWSWNSPPIDFHPFRQVQALMVARNFPASHMNIFSPQVDWLSTTRAPERLPVGGTEFCVVPWFTSFVYAVVGESHWAGRVVPFLFGLLAVGYFYRFLRLLTDRSTAVCAASLLCISPLFVITGQVQMPEAFAFAMAFAALFYFERWLEQPGRGRFALAAISMMFMLLGKPQLAVLGVAFAFLAWRRFGKQMFANKSLYAIAMTAFLPAAAYVAYSGSLTAKSGVSFAIPQLFGYHWFLQGDFWLRLPIWLLKWTTDVCLVALAIWGLVRAKGSALTGIALSFAIAGIALVVIMPGATYSNPQYLMLFPPAAIILAANLITSVAAGSRANVIRGGLLLGSVLLSLYAVYDMRRPTVEAEMRCGEWLRTNTPEDALVLTAGESPTTLYFARRLGWTCWYENYGEPVVLGYDLINRVGKLGGRFLAFSSPELRSTDDDDRKLFDDLLRTYDAYHDYGFVVFALTRRADLGVPGEVLVDFAVPANWRFLRRAWFLPSATLDPLALPSLSSGKTASIEFKSAVAPRSVEFIALCPDGATLQIDIKGQVAQQVSLPPSASPQSFSAAVNSAVPESGIISVDISRPDSQAGTFELSGFILHL